MERQTAPPGNGYRGPSSVDFPGTGYTADTYSKGSYRAEKGGLMEITEDLVVRSGLWPPDEARRRILAISEGIDPQNFSWIGFRKLDASPGQYEGAALQDVLHIPTVRGDIPLLFMRLRVFLPEARRKHLGRTAMQLAIHAHSDAEPTHIAHRTCSPAAAYSWLMADVFKPGRRFPFDSPFDRDFIAFMLLFNIYDVTRVRGKLPNKSTGVSIGEYLEPNRAYVPDPTHVPTMGIKKWMEERLNMNFQRGDALTQVGELR